MNYSSKIWGLFGVVLTLIISIPIISIFIIAWSSEVSFWGHLFSTVLPSYATNTIFLMIGNVFGVCLIGVPTAWLVTSYSFPGRNIFSWALILPLAIPAYIIAFVYTDVFEYSGAFQVYLRNIFEKQEID